MTVTPWPPALPQLRISSSLSQTIERPCRAVGYIASSLLDKATTIYSAAVGWAAYLSVHEGVLEGGLLLTYVDANNEASRILIILYKPVSRKPKQLE